MGKKKLAGIARRLVIVVAVVLFCYSAYQLISTFLEYRQGTEEYDNLENLVFAQMPTQPPARITEQAEPKQTEEKQDITETQPGLQEETVVNLQQEAQMNYVDFATLKEMNEDSVAWIILYGTNINYPVLQGEDNDFYLHHTFNKKANAAGSVFIDAAIEEGMEGKNVIVYGHNMRNGSMFGTLAYYKNEQMFKNYPAFLVYTENGAYEYAIYAAFTTTAGSNVYIPDFGSEESFLEYIDRMKGLSLYDTGVEVSADDKIMTLSTCSGSNNGRFVVQAKRIEPEEEQK